MKRSLIVLVLLALLVAGCAKKHSPGMCKIAEDTTAATQELADSLNVRVDELNYDLYMSYLKALQVSFECVTQK